jgi:hypothetical protein
MTDTTPDQLAALDRAARERDDPWVAELAHDKLGRELIRAYRAKQLVLIGPDAVEVVARAICNAHCEDIYGVIDSHMVENEWADWIPEATTAIAALTGRV